MKQEQKLLFLEKAKEAIEFGWCQGQYAKDGKGEGTSYNSESACCFCLSGALLRSRDAIGENVSSSFGFALRKELGIWSLEVMGIQLSLMDGMANFAHFNDNPKVTQVDVVAFLDHCINKVETLAL